MSTAVDCIIMDHIDRGHFDRELGEMTRDPKYAEYTAIEIKAVLTEIRRVHRYRDKGGAN
jgi:hypothetical protein